MLKKECCIKCINETVDFEGGWKFIRKWEKFDEENWKRWIVYCPLKFVERGWSNISFRKDEPPSKCPYILEHTV